MPQPLNLLVPLFIFIFVSFWILNGVVSEPQTNLLENKCEPHLISYVFPDSNVSVFNQDLNATLQDIKEQISTVQNKHFDTAHEDKRGNPASPLFQCRNYLSVVDCVACLEAATNQIRLCATGTSDAYVVYDGCFLGYN